MSTINRRSISYTPIDTNVGESLSVANDKITHFFENIQSQWIGYIYAYADARASQVITVNATELHPDVQQYINNYWFDVNDPPNLVMEKIYDLPSDMQADVYNNHFNPSRLHQKSGLGYETRAVFFDTNTGLYSFANGKLLFNSYSDMTAILGNYDPDKYTVDLIINGLYYDFSRNSLIPGKTYFLSDSMPGWLIDYQEGGKNNNISVPMSVSISPHAAVLLTDRAIVKDLPCGQVGQPDSLRFAEYIEYVDVTNGDPFDDPNEIVYYGYEPIGQ